AEVVFVSALTKQRVPKILEAAARAYEQNRRRVSTSLVNQVINEATALTPPPSGKRGRPPRITYTAQAALAPTNFIPCVDEPKLLVDTYRVYLERKIREACGFAGSAIRIILRAKSKEK